MAIKKKAGPYERSGWEAFVHLSQYLKPAVNVRLRQAPTALA
ncbi:hypothetical protein [Alloacidobacterium dinghuense]|nr:hypothetical protein [Alloacidobacterium dinghuense]